MNSILYRRSITNISDTSEAFMNWTICLGTPGNSPSTCSVIAFNMFPISFWRTVTSDTARASFGIVFFLVEITKGYRRPFIPSLERDFWRAIKERVPFPRHPRGPASILFSHPPSQANIRERRACKLAPLLPKRLRNSFHPRHSNLPTTVQSTTSRSMGQPDKRVFASRDPPPLYNNFPRTRPNQMHSSTCLQTSPRGLEPRNSMGRGHLTGSYYYETRRMPFNGDSWASRSPQTFLGSIPSESLGRLGRTVRQGV